MQNNFSYWEKTSFLSGFDTFIVGAGIVGLSAAIHLKKLAPALKIGIIETGFLPSGASTKNAGFACFGSVSELLDKLKTTSENKLLEVVELRWLGLQKLRENLGDAAINFIASGGFELFRKDEKNSSRYCLDHIEYLNKILKPIIGKSDIYSVENEKIADFGFNKIDTLIQNKYEGQLDVGKMMQALISKAYELNITIFNNCKLLNIQEEGEQLILKTNRVDFKASKLILTINAFAKNIFPQLDITPGRGQVLVTEPVSNLKINGTFHYDKGYYYFRNIGKRLLLGGGRNLDFETEETTEFGLTDKVQLSLEKFLREVILPSQSPKIEYRWSGIMGFGAELKPIIKEVRKGIYTAIRCNGMGVAMGTLSGQKIAELVLRDI
jgi:glycine/D-amino acid oxidase-like deaminating enzyme